MVSPHNNGGDNGVEHPKKPSPKEVHPQDHEGYFNGPHRKYLNAYQDQGQEPPQVGESVTVSF